MIIWLFLLLIVPSLIATLYYEHIIKQKSNLLNQIVTGCIYCYFINFFAISIIWLRGHDYLYWTLDGRSDLNHVQFCVKYMLITIVLAVLLPWIAVTIRTASRMKQIGQLISNDSDSDSMDGSGDVAANDSGDVAVDNLEKK